MKHYSINSVSAEDGMGLLRKLFPEGEAQGEQFVLFSTSGIHGTYRTIEEVESREGHEYGELTFLVIRTRVVEVFYGNCLPVTEEDFAFLKRLRNSSLYYFEERRRNLPPFKEISGPVELFPVGQCMASHDGEQVGELQKSFMQLWAENAEAHGYNPEGVKIKLPKGGLVTIVAGESGWAWDAQ